MEASLVLLTVQCANFKLNFTNCTVIKNIRSVKKPLSFHTLLLEAMSVIVAGLDVNKAKLILQISPKQFSSTKFCYSVINQEIPHQNGNFHYN